MKYDFNTSQQNYVVKTVLFMLIEHQVQFSSSSARTEFSLMSLGPSHANSYDSDVQLPAYLTRFKGSNEVSNCKSAWETHSYFLNLVIILIKTLIYISLNTYNTTLFFTFILQMKTLNNEEII